MLSPAGLRAAFVAAAVEGVILGFRGIFLFLFLFLVARALSSLLVFSFYFYLLWAHSGGPGEVAFLRASAAFNPSARTARVIRVLSAEEKCSGLLLASRRASEVHTEDGRAFS